ETRSSVTEAKVATERCSNGFGTADLTPSQSELVHWLGVTDRQELAVQTACFRRHPNEADMAIRRQVEVYRVLVRDVLVPDLPARHLAVLRVTTHPCDDESARLAQELRGVSLIVVNVPGYDQFGHPLGVLATLYQQLVHRLRPGVRPLGDGVDRVVERHDQFPVPGRRLHLVEKPCERRL